MIKITETSLKICLARFTFTWLFATSFSFFISNPLNWQEYIELRMGDRVCVLFTLHDVLEPGTRFSVNKHSLLTVTHYFEKREHYIQNQVLVLLFFKH